MKTIYQAKKPAVLVLQDGKVFHGKVAGKIGTTTGEICFNTGMTGYQEVFTDPSYTGQILVTTNVHIGNYGVNSNETESDSVKIAGLVCKKFNEFPSRQRSDGSLKDYFEKEQVVGICEIDTRAVVRYIRDKGSMNAIISSDNLDVTSLLAKLALVPSMEGLELSSRVSTRTAYTSGSADAKYRVALIDLGVKRNIIQSLVERGCYVQVFPMKTSFAEIKRWNPDGFMISNGPGDPGVMPDEIKLIKEIMNSNIPTFGICLGHQLIAEACGIATYKMKNGHRGINHPVKNMISGKSEITSQNHGFSVKSEDVKGNAELEITHVNLNDGTIEGLRHKTKDVFCVQYHPESTPGPLDSRYLFDQFVELMAKVKIKKPSTGIAV
ncbi:MAG TPA: glutamine-hydrolyzing carbamoyl-phosphate synthase small subunit [Bacteroidia bacterium]|jgi:carbamoyl-phosphate synthase small subunit|nr:glutamine-hydrolyzing carbamoyl-phosphate synthase small subunit [Bacteroidia bacterium]